MCILLTRFNNSTWRENEEWREKNKWKGCLYGTCTPCTNEWENACVLEMNNDTNSILGIGIITRYIRGGASKSKWKVYRTQKYNNHLYLGKRRIDRGELDAQDQYMVAFLDKLLFKGKTHSKRGEGLSAIPAWIQENEIIDVEAELNAIMNKNAFIY